MKALTRKQLFVLRATIKGFAAEAQQIRKKQIVPASGPERLQGWDRKRTLGYHARVHLLAYALLRGLKREEQESSPRYARANHNGDWAIQTLSEDIYKVCRQYGTYRVYWYREFTKVAVMEWLKGGENILFVRPDENRKQSRKLFLTGKATLKKPAKAS